jgi:Pectate lyase superfamily protein
MLRLQPTQIFIQPTPKLALTTALCATLGLSACGGGTAASDAAVQTSATATAAMAAVLPEPEQPAPPQIPDLRFDVTTYGAVPNDGVDDTAAIQRAIDDAAGRGGGSVVFANGRYDVSIQPASDERPQPQALLARSKVRLIGADASRGAVLRLADAQGQFETLIGTARYADELTDFEIDGLTFDANGSGNPVLRPDGSDPCCANSPDFGSGSALTPRFVLRVYVGQRVRVANTTFVDHAGVNTITFNGTDVFDVQVVNSKFERIGSDAADFDHSSIYTNATRAAVIGCDFSTRSGAGTRGARAAIEAHGIDQTVQDNLISGFTYGINAVADVGPLAGLRQLYRNNQLSEVASGIVLWPLRGPRDAAARSLADVEITGNRIGLNLDDWRNATALTYPPTSGAGIALEPSASDAPIDRLVIRGNTVVFTKASGAGTSYFEQRSAGITLDLPRDLDPPVRGLIIANNRIENPLGPGMFVGVPVEPAGEPFGGSNGGITSVIESNTIVNPARGNELRYQAAKPFRAGIYLEGTSRNVTVRSNRIEAMALPAYRISVPAPCSSQCEVAGNEGPAEAGTLLGPGWLER